MIVGHRTLEETNQQDAETTVKSSTALYMPQIFEYFF